jgi:hypothetical protein
VKIVVITTLVATKPYRCDKKAWYKGQKLVVDVTNTVPYVMNGFVIDVHTVLSPFDVYMWDLWLLIQCVI